MLLYLYTIEPPFYYDLCMASKSMDESKLDNLGPFSRAFYELLAFTDEIEQKREDKFYLGR